jgi:ribosome maturation factor RimP
MATPEESASATPEQASGPDDDVLMADGFGSPVADRVHALLAPVVATVDVDLVDVQWAGGVLRLAVEKTDADPSEKDGVSTDTLAQINRLVSPLLDQHDPVPGRYTLEVSSPGVERPLRRAEHFARAVGEDVIVKTVPGHEHRRFRGLLRSVADGALDIEVVEIDGVDLPEPIIEAIAMADVASARTHFSWGPTPKKGGKGSNKGPNKGQANRPKGSAKGPKQQSAGKKNGKTTEEERGRT